MSNPQSDIQINPRAEPQIEREMDSEKKADAYDPVVRTESDDVEQGKVRPFLGAQHQDIIPDSIGPNFIRAEHMIALAGAIGTGLFLGSGKSIRRAGPAGTLIGYGFMGAVVICVMGCLAELSALAPLSGAYVRHSEYFVDPALSFAIGWIAVYGPCVSVPSEWVAVSVIVQYWTDINGGVWIAICIVLAFATNIFLIRIFGEVELICAMLKIMLILGLILFGLIFDLGGVPNQHRLGFQYWRNPGAFGEGYLVTGAAGRFAGFYSVFINAAFSFAGLETTAIAAAETKNPRRNVPRAAKHIFVRVTVFYLLSLFIVGLIVPSNDPKLLASTGNAASSPFIIAAENAGVKVLPSIVNAVIITSAWSSGNHGILQGSRSLYALALESKAPKVFRRVTRFGIPWVAVCFQSLFTLNTDANTVFGWLQNLTAASTLAVWITIGICSLRVRQAMKKQGISADRLPWAAPFQPHIAHFAIWANSIVLLTGGFYVFVSGNWNISDFFSNYFTIPLWIGLYIGYKIIFKTKIVPLDKVPVANFIAIADANPEPPLHKKPGIVGWFGRFWWD